MGVNLLGGKQSLLSFSRDGLVRMRVQLADPRFLIFLQLKKNGWAWVLNRGTESKNGYFWLLLFQNSYPPLLRNQAFPLCQISGALGALTPSFLKANGSYLLPRVLGALAGSLFNLFKKRNEKPCYTKEGIGPNGVSVLRCLIPPFYSSPMLLGRNR